VSEVFGHWESLCEWGNTGTARQGAGEQASRRAGEQAFLLLP
jgi:hypothetical protein